MVVEQPDAQPARVGTNFIDIRARRGGRDHRVAESSYRLITFDLELEPTLTGFIARVAEVLAAANVPILPFAAFSRDHLLVPSDRFDAAWAALQKLQMNG